MIFETISAQWQDQFEGLVSHIREYGLIVSPYITTPPVERIVDILRRQDAALTIRLDVLTDLSTPHILYGSTDPTAILLLMDAVPGTRITYLPRLHAKVYIADESEAIITSANLTEHGLLWNYEYGVRIVDPTYVRQIREDILAYGRLGNLVSRPEIERLAQIAEELREKRQRIEREAKEELLKEFQQRVNDAENELMEIRASGKTTNGIFADTIVYLLRKYGPMRTVELHPRIQQIHPDLCNDSIDRVIKGVHFGKKWKHYVRNAQQTLKRQGVIDFDGQKWYLIQENYVNQ